MTRRPGGAKMLSRVAERLYWFGRYLERTENIARLLSVYTNLVLDLPKEGFVWESLVSITGFEHAFKKRFANASERNVVKFLLEDPSCSLRHCVRMARENARTSRDLMPNEAWQKINELHLYLSEDMQQRLKRDGRFEFLSRVIDVSLELTGYLNGSMSEHTPYHFIKMGCYLERADMTTRIIDVACLNFLKPDRRGTTEYDNILWMGVLKSLNAYQMYRQHVQERVNGEDVADYLLKDRYFPRSVAHCLKQVAGSFSQLQHKGKPHRRVSQTQRRISKADLEFLLKENELHDFIDLVQLDLARIHADLSSTWLR